MNRFGAAWQLVRQSLAVLMAEKRLLFFPLVTGVLTLVVFLFFLAPVVLQPSGHSYLEAEHWETVVGSILPTATSPAEAGGGSPGAMPDEAPGESVEFSAWFLGYLTVLYLASMFLLTFFNTAFFNEIIHALNGQRVSILGGLRFALTRLKPIATWSLFAGVVGLLIQRLEHQLGFFARWIVGLIGIVWSVASVFAVPVLIRDENPTKPFEVLKKSAKLIKARWGEGLIGYVGLRGAGVAFAAAVILFYAVLLAVLVPWVDRAWPSLLGPVVAAIVVAWFASIVLVGYLASLVNKVFQCALYIYAAEGAIPGTFDERLLDTAWKVRKTAP